MKSYLGKTVSCFLKVWPTGIRNMKESVRDFKSVVGKEISIENKNKIKTSTELRYMRVRTFIFEVKSTTLWI